MLIKTHSWAYKAMALWKDCVSCWGNYKEIVCAKTESCKWINSNQQRRRWFRNNQCSFEVDHIIPLVEGNGLFFFFLFFFFLLHQIWLVNLHIPKNIPSFYIVRKVFFSTQLKKIGNTHTHILPVQFIMMYILTIGALHHHNKWANPIIILSYILCKSLAGWYEQIHSFCW